MGLNNTTLLAVLKISFQFRWLFHLVVTSRHWQIGFLDNLDRLKFKREGDATLTALIKVKNRRSPWELCGLLTSIHLLVHMHVVRSQKGWQRISYLGNPDVWSCYPSINNCCLKHIIWNISHENNFHVNNIALP